MGLIMGQIKRTDEGELDYGEEADALDSGSAYFQPKEADAEEEMEKARASVALGHAVCPKCSKPLLQRMTSRGPKWVCGCPQKG